MARTLSCALVIVISPGNAPSSIYEFAGPGEDNINISHRVVINNAARQNCVMCSYQLCLAALPRSQWRAISVRDSSSRTQSMLRTKRSFSCVGTVSGVLILVCVRRGRYWWPVRCGRLFMFLLSFSSCCSSLRKLITFSATESNRSCGDSNNCVSVVSK